MQVQEIRAPLLRPFDCTFKAPNRVALYLFKDKSYVVENFRDEPVTVEVSGTMLQLPARGWAHKWQD